MTDSNLEKLLILEKEYNKINVFENKNILDINELPEWKIKKIMNKKLEDLKTELIEYKENHTGYDPELPDFNIEIYDVVEKLENKIIELELNYSFSSFNKFNQYLINVGIRSAEYTYSEELLFEHIDYFKKCYKEHLSAYKALLFFGDYLEELKQKKSE